MRREYDGLGEMLIPDEAYYGIHTARAKENFSVSGCRLSKVFIQSFANVKMASAQTNLELGFLGGSCARAIITACRELAEGRFHDQIVVDALQGGAGTSANMNVNEVIANRAIELLGHAKGDYAVVHPIDHVNLHQSTNDVFPTALRVAALVCLRELELEISALQESFQQKELEFHDVVKVARTQLQDAVPMTLGMEFGAYSEAVARDRWRVFKARERIKQVNLGGTAVGTGLGAPRPYIFRVVENLRDITGLNISRAENLVDGTQNLDCFPEASGMLKAYAVNLFKIASDLRLLSSGPDAGLAEITLPARQAGSSIMAGKVNPVIPEMVSQVALRVMANDQVVSLVAALGQLDLNQFLPLLAHSLLESLGMLSHSTRKFRELCVSGIQASPHRCMDFVLKSRSLAAVLVPVYGYGPVEVIVKQAAATGKTVLEAAVESKMLSVEEANALLAPKRMHKLGFTVDEHGESD